LLWITSFSLFLVPGGYCPAGSSAVTSCPAGAIEWDANLSLICPRVGSGLGLGLVLGLGLGLQPYPPPPLLPHVLTWIVRRSMFPPHLLFVHLFLTPYPSYFLSPPPLCQSFLCPLAVDRALPLLVVTSSAPSPPRTLHTFLFAQHCALYVFTSEGISIPPSSLLFALLTLPVLVLCGVNFFRCLGLFVFLLELRLRF
jgi:hypothetical protein